MAPKKIQTGCSDEYPLVITRGITLSKNFTYKDDLGAPINLTGKTVQVKFKSVFTTNPLILTSVATTLGSNVSIPTPTNGTFFFTLTDEETATALLKSGRWWAELHDAGNVSLLLRGDVRVEDV